MPRQVSRVYPISRTQPQPVPVETMELRDFRTDTIKPRWTSPFEPFILSDDERKRLRLIAQNTLESNIGEYEEFIFQHNSKLVPERAWKFLRRDSQVETYVRRPEKYGLNGFGTTKRIRHDTASETSDSVGNTQIEEVTSLDVVDMRSIGLTSGTKEDAVYGVMNPTTITMRIKSAYVDDGIQDCNVLNVIQNPTPDDPFSTLSVRWRVTENPPVVNWIIKSYDHVYVDATGITTLSNGEQVTYQLLHSIEFSKAIPKLPQYSRGQVAGIVFYRQVGENLVSVWARGVFTVPMERARVLFEPVIGAAMSKSVINNFQAAQMKKLRWALHRRQQELRKNPSGNFTTENLTTTAQNSLIVGNSNEKACIKCSKKRKVRTSTDCDLCGVHVCGTCCIKHKVAYVELDNKLRWHKVRVCSFCMARVVKMHAAEAIAIECAAGEYERIN